MTANHPSDFDSSNKKVDKIVYFVRHGQSIDNASPAFQSTESPLSEKGKQQAEYIAKRISRIPFDALIASPLPRAKETTEIIAQVTNKDPEYSDLFVERIKPSYVSGKPYTDERANTLWRVWDKSLYTSDIRAEDGENFDDIVARVDKALSFLQDRKEHSLVVVTHGFFLRAMIARVLFGELLTPELFKRFQRRALMENTGISVLRYHDGFEEDAMWRLWIYNDHTHLS